MNPQKLIQSKANNDAHEFVDELSKVLTDMGVTSENKPGLAFYQLMDVAKCGTPNG